VIETAADAATIRRAHHHRTRVLARGPPAHLRQFRDDLIERRVDEVDELDLGDRLHAVERHADRATHDPVLGQWSVRDPLRPELGLQPLGDAEDASVLADVLTHQDHARVLAQRDAECVLDRLDHRHGCQRKLSDRLETAQSTQAPSRRQRRCPVDRARAARPGGSEEFHADAAVVQPKISLAENKI
jgi:hypothetical protein